MPNLVNRTIVLCDATTGDQVRVIVTESGKLYKVEGLSYDLIQDARKAVARIAGCSAGSSSPIQQKK
jgi:hypothetical protein